MTSVMCATSVGNVRMETRAFEAGADPEAGVANISMGQLLMEMSWLTRINDGGEFTAMVDVKKSGSENWREMESNKSASQIKEARKGEEAKIKNLTARLGRRLGVFGE